MKAKATITFVALLFAALAVRAGDVGGPPQPDEVLGFWKMVPIDKPELNKVNPWPLPYQWFAFYPDGHFVSMAKTENVEYNRKQLEAIFEVMKADSPRYSWRQNFLLIEYPDVPGKFEMWGVNIFRKDVRFARAGDLMMTLAGGEDGAPVYYRHLEPVK